MPDTGKRKLCHDDGLLEISKTPPSLYEPRRLVVVVVVVIVVVVVVVVDPQPTNCC